MIKEKWNCMNEAEKKPYFDLCLPDKERFEREMAQYRESGYFTDEDGVHSLDLAIEKRNFKPHVVRPKRVLRAFEIFVSTNYKSKRDSL
jgi:hypothetical protein